MAINQAASLVGNSVDAPYDAPPLDVLIPQKKLEKCRQDRNDDQGAERHPHGRQPTIGHTARKQRVEFEIIFHSIARCLKVRGAWARSTIHSRGTLPLQDLAGSTS